MTKNRDRSNFTIGLFVIIGLLIGITTVVWLGVSDYFAAGTRYVTYFDESVQGLSADSSVKYRGVTVGRVEQIDIAPDNRHIEVVMKVDVGDDMHHSTIAQLKPVGITGMVFVELNLRDPDETLPVQELSFEPAYPVIPSKPSGISEVFARIHLLADKILEIDFKGITDEVRSAARTLRSVLSNPAIEDIIRNLDTTAIRLEETLTRVHQIMDDEELEEVIRDMRETLAEGKAFLAAAGEAVREADLPGTSRQIAGLAERLEEGIDEAVDSIDNAARLSTLEIRDAGSQFRRTARSIEELFERLYLSPSDLIFGGPPPRDEEGE